MDYLYIQKINLFGKYIINLIFPERKITVQKRKDNLVTFGPNGSVIEFYLHSSS